MTCSHRLALLALLAGCDQTLRVADGRDAGRDASSPPIDAYVSVDDAAVIDAASACSPGTASCLAGERRVCASAGAGFDWIAAPCAAGQACEGQGQCTTVGGLDLRSSVAAIAWAHTDIGATEASATSAGADRFAFGISVANTSSAEAQIFVRTMVMSIDTSVPGHTGAVQLAPWWDRITLAAPTGMAPVVPTSSTWEPTMDFGFVTSTLPIAVWGTSPSAGRAVIDSFCAGATPPASCRARSFEGTLLSGTEGTSFVVVSAPVEAWWDSCAGHVVVDGTSSVGLAHASAGTYRIHVVASTEIAASSPPLVPIVESDTPGLVAAGATLDTAFYGGVFQLVARAPTSELECAATITGTDCLHPCAPRDLTGTLVTATLPIQAVASHDCSRVRPGDGTCGHATEALLPTSSLGTTHVVPGPLPWESDVRVRVVATQDGTTIEGLPTAYDAGRFFDVDAVAGLQIVASAPVAVVRTSRRAGSEGRSATVALLATDRWATRYVVPRQPDARAIVVTPTGSSVQLDGAPPTQAPTPLGDGLHELRVMATEGGAGYAAIETSAPALVLTAIVPDWSASFAITRGARR